MLTALSSKVRTQRSQRVAVPIWTTSTLRIYMSVSFFSSSWGLDRGVTRASSGALGEPVYNSLAHGITPSSLV